VTQRRFNLPELLMGIGIIAVGLLMAFEAASIRVIPLYAKVGPAAFLWVAAGLLMFCGALVGWHASRSPETEQNEMRGPIVIMAALAASPFLMEPLGFILTAVGIFTSTAYGLGSRSFLRDLAIAAILSVVAYFVFTKGLGLRLPQGLLPL
jgi:putative tricarboxylic transport membrane protein